MNAKPFIYATLSFGILLSAGCMSDAVNTVENYDKAALPLQMRDVRIVTDQKLASRVAVQQIHTSNPSPEKPVIRMQAEVENLTREPLSVNYLIEWYDDDGMRVDGAAAGWKQLRLASRESYSLVSTAPSPKARDFRIKLLAVEE